MSSEPEAGAPSADPADLISPRQRDAVTAYTERLLGPELAGPAAEDAIFAFTRIAAQRSDLGTAPQSELANETLLALTRLMAAVTVPDRSAPEDRRQAVWASIGAASHCTCRESAALLATRANENIQPRESAALDDHLAGCEACRRLAADAAAADAAFTAALTPPAGGSGIGAVPRATFAAATVLVGAAVAAIALTTGSRPPSIHPARPALTPVQTQSPSSFALATTTATTATPTAHHHGARHPAAHHRVDHHPARAGTAVSSPPVATSASTPAGSASTPSATAGTGSGVPGASAPAAASTGTPARRTPPARTTAGSGAGSTSAPASTGSTSGGSLPADSAPQQGIGGLTGTTPQ
ncbi:zf-HC2 domain-containing protein [Conexibacter sp. DBS9H8]|uniref:zf-HC2 domain-containing protein n=1 Tax=Conexibacter sp. DBS9H8 TaxID=2937801 RepID=UPI00200EB212|nr:zf-HC2 domain-containing protein [Conexibacter sp. DBS9H8]